MPCRCAAGGAAPSGGLPSTTAILHTTDGGQTWQKTYSGSVNQELFDIACPGSIGGTSVGQ